jgi:hypothetical protein
MMTQKLDALVTRLRGMLSGIEPVFGEAGGALAAAVDPLDDLRRSFGAMAARIEAEDATAAIAALQEVSAGIASLGAGSVASQRRLDDLHASTAALGPRMARLKKTIGEVRVLAVNAKVEAAHVTARDMDFSVFTREIDRLAGLAGKALEQLSAELGELLSIIAGARGDLAAFVRDHGHALAQVGTQLGRGLDAMAERRRQSVAAICSLAELSQHMTSAIAHAVEGLQVGDMTRQRGEHVAEALQTLAEVVAANDLPAQHRQILITSVCRLQAAQAAGAGSDLERETVAIGRNLDVLAADLAGLPVRCGDAYGASGDQRASFLAELSHEMQAAQQLLGVYARARAGVDTVLSRIAQMVAGMVHHMEAIHSIEADMRVMGLNATFKCSRLGGQGRGLSIIAQELRAYANRTAEDGAAAMADMNALMNQAKRMDSEECQGHSADRMEAAMVEAVRVLGTVGDDLTHGLQSLAHGCARATRSLDKARRLLRSHMEFGATFAHAAATLAEIAGPAPLDAAAMDGIRAEVLGLLRTRYTMSAERKVHELLGGEESGTRGMDAAVQADDFLF